MAAFLLWMFHSVSAAALEQTFSLPEIINNTPKITVTTEVDDRHRARMLLSWQAITNASSYKVVVSRDKDFQNAREFMVDTNHMQFTVFADEVYYWRVVAYHKNGQRLSAVPKQIFRFLVEKSSAGHIQ